MLEIFITTIERNLQLFINSQIKNKVLVYFTNHVIECNIQKYLFILMYFARLKLIISDIIQYTCNEDTQVLNIEMCDKN